jgi:flagellar motor switch protein FliN/FliY
MEKMNIVKNLQDMDVIVSIELGRKRMPIKDVMKLNEGETIALDRLAGEEVDIFVSNVLYAKGEVCVLDETNYTIRITKVLAKDEESDK